MIISNLDNITKKTVKRGISLKYPCEDQSFAPHFKEKKINVFVSSTFHDMIAERDELTLKIFPALRKECEIRGISWGEIDLRWGIPPEKSEKGETLNICLQCVDKCRPYFIGILGERYGWIDPDIREKINDDFSWILEQSNKSITELEILHGVLINPKIGDHAFFYFRDKEYLESEIFKSKVPEPEREEFFESQEDRKQKLVDLKERIRKSGFPVRENYPDPVSFGELVKNDLMKVINSLAPLPHENSSLNKFDFYLEQERVAHETFVASRFGVYIRRKEYFDRLDAQANGEGVPLVVLGESGSGKSALLAHWGFNYQKLNPEQIVLFHFIGASPTSSNWTMMIRRIMGELKRECGIKEEIPTKDYEIRSEFGNFLSKAGKIKKVILIIDALDQLEDHGGVVDLSWLPPNIPPGIRLVLSTLPGRPLEALKDRHWEEMEVFPLTEEEEKHLIICYLKQFNKEPQPELIQELVASEQCKNPLFLRAVLEEIRIHGVYEKLINQVQNLLTATSISSLYEMILARYELDYEIEHPRLVRKVMGLIWASRQGLSKDELLDILGKDGKPLADAIWAPFYLATEKGLVERNGLLTFFHEYLKKAVENKYLLNIDEKKKIHLKIANYFEQRSQGVRLLDELPWQLLAGEDWSRLIAVLSDEVFFRIIYENSNYDLKHYWVTIEEKTHNRIVETYQSALESPDKYSNEYLYNLAHFFNDTGHPDQAEQLYLFLITQLQDNPIELKDLKADLGVIYMNRGDLERALNIFQDLEQIYRKINDNHGLQSCLGNQAKILNIYGDIQEAMALHKKEEKICREFNYFNGLSLSLNSQGCILKDRGELDRAMELFQETEKLCFETGDLESLQCILGNKGLIHYERGNFTKAMELFKRGEDLCRKYGMVKSLSSQLNNQALLLKKCRDYNDALKIQKEAEEICRKLEDIDGLQICLGNQANILFLLGDVQGAMELYKIKEQYCRDLNNIQELQAAIGNQGNIQYRLGNVSEAMKLFKEKEKYCREIDFLRGLQSSLGSQALVLHKQGDFNKALELSKEQEQICRKIESQFDLQCCLGDQASILKDKKDYPGALKSYKEKEQICRLLGISSEIQNSLLGQATILPMIGDYDTALIIFQELEEEYLQNNDKESVLKCLYGQIGILIDLERLDDSINVLNEIVQISTDLGNVDQAVSSMLTTAEMLQLLALEGNENAKRISISLLVSLAKLESELREMGEFLQEQGKLNEAMTLFQQCENICRNVMDEIHLLNILQIQVSVLGEQGNPEKALIICKEIVKICREQNNLENLQIALGNLAIFSSLIEDNHTTIKIYKEQEQICRNLQDFEELQKSLKNQAEILYEQQQYQDALLLFQEQEEICRNLKDMSSLQNSIGNQANIFSIEGHYNTAKKLYQEQEQICRQNNFIESLASSLSNQGFNELSCGNHDSALTLINKGYQLALDNGYHDTATQIKEVMRNKGL